MEIDNLGTTLNVAVDGDPDSPPVLCLHGITCCLETWDFLVPVLAQRHRVVRLDFRGHGRSARAAGHYHFADYVSDAISVCEQVLRKPCVIVGHSLGGGTAVGLAQQRPDLVTGLVLEDPALLAKGDELFENATTDAIAVTRQALPALQSQCLGVDDVVPMITAMPSPTGPPMGDILQPDAIKALALAFLNVDPTVLDVVIERRIEPVYDATQTIPVRGLVLAAD